MVVGGIWGTVFLGHVDVLGDGGGGLNIFFEFHPLGVS